MALPAIVLLNILLITVIRCLPISAQQLSPFWNGYSSCSLDLCITPLLSISGCQSNYACVCTNTTFVSLIATCLGEFCPSDIIYGRYSNNCTTSGYIFALSETAYDNAWADGHTSSPFWTVYPACTLDNCFVPEIENSGCSGADTHCICMNDTLVTSIAECEGRACPNDVIYNMYSTNCSSAGYSFGLSQTQYNEAWQTGHAETTTIESTVSQMVSFQFFYNDLKGTN